MSMPRQAPVSVIVTCSVFDAELIDRRPRTWGLRLGTLRDSCYRVGVRFSTGGNEVTVTGKRRQMMKFLENVHFSGVPYRVV